MSEDFSVRAFFEAAIFDYVLPVLFLVAFLTFMWGTFQYYIQGSSDEEVKEKAKALMFYGVLAFLLMLSVWTLFTIVIPLRDF